VDGGVGRAADGGVDDDGVLERLAGQDVSLDDTNPILTASGATYTLAGQVVTLTARRTLSIDSGSFALTGQDITFDPTRVLTADRGLFAFTGEDVLLEYSGASTARLDVYVWERIA
jgi:hypothetical protein